jgi:hypothetical protein
MTSDGVAAYIVRYCSPEFKFVSRNSVEYICVMKGCISLKKKSAYDRTKETTYEEKIFPKCSEKFL